METTCTRFNINKEENVLISGTREKSAVADSADTLFVYTGSGFGELEGDCRCMATGSREGRSARQSWVLTKWPHSFWVSRTSYKKKILTNKEKQ